uniref:RING-type E3 ubiquitin transferase n=1 Tax=Neogobius melanostomus TaxID=47308 RepID=A0A8C6WG52_9GOBI
DESVTSPFCAQLLLERARRGEGAERRARETQTRSQMLTLSADMDESSSLLDLLECSVCLERLDTTAKVLPCQHTFCRRCLENILSSRNELRCPECRILQRPHPFPGLTSGLRCRNMRFSSGQCFKRAACSMSTAGVCYTHNIPALPCGKALYSYEGKEPGDLQFSKGDIIILRRKVDDNWYHGELNGCHGFLPASYIQLLRPLSQTPPQGKALYDFEVKDKDQDKDCLAFSKDSVLTVIRRVDENWAEGMLGDKIGIFPILYVELNETAKQLMEIDKPTTTSAPGPSSEPSTLGSCSSGSSPCASPSNGNGSGPRRGEGKKNAKKRHSFTALSVTQRAAQLNNRHSMEISNPVLISSSDPRAAARIQVNTQGPDISSNGAKQLLAHAKVQLPLNIYLALYAYKPQKADELELRKGEMYRVTEKCQDGWFKGTSLRTAASGVFPGNYVTPVSSYDHDLCFMTCIILSLYFSAQSSRRQPRAPHGSGVPPAPQSCSPSRQSGRPLSMVSPGSSLGPSPLSSPASRPLLPLSSPLSCLTPPNVSAALLHSEPASPVQSPSPGPSHVTTQGVLAPKVEKVCFFNVYLQCHSTKIEPQSISRLFFSISCSQSLIPSDDNANSVMLWQGRAGSCPIESDMGAIGLEPLHRKSGSLDTNFPRSLPATRTGSALMALRPEPKPLSRERYRVVVPYPPQSEAEIELREGDVVFVHKKRDDGWYKGTLQRNGQTGLFPGSFVESF